MLCRFYPCIQKTVFLITDLIMQHLARTYFALKKYDEAKKYYLQAIKSPIMETKVRIL
jgi:tetratricopeptide (TPR) repeat protein